jgi:2-isopropylmalate synthase
LKQVYLYDTTLRDGAQSEGVSFSVVDKIRITEKLDEMGISYVEGGWPGSNPKDAEFLDLVCKLKLKKARIAVFGSTRRVGLRAEDDNNLRMLVKTGASVATIVAKSSARQVTQVLGTTLEENLNMISDSVRYLRANGMTVFVDAEHFFDGFKVDPEYSLRTLGVAAEAGAECVVLCDTNGGALVDEVSRAVDAAARVMRVATQVQGTINGYGERCGNANLCTIIPSLKLKMGIDCVSDEQLARLTEVSRLVSDTANLSPDPFSPYVGASAFSHKAGYHVDGLAKWEQAYQHIDPSLVGNWKRAVISELSGRDNILFKAKELGISIPSDKASVQALLSHIKQAEGRGYQFENAEASFELLLHKSLPGYKPPFELIDFMVLVETRRRAPVRNHHEETLAEAMIKVRVDGEVMHTAAEGNGPVNALDQALRKALLQFYPSLATVKLVDYKVRILEESVGTESQVRVFIESSDGVRSWRTVGSSANIIEASWLALADSVEYWLAKRAESH